LLLYVDPALGQALIDVQRPLGTSIASDEDDFQGNHLLDNQVTLEYTIKNNGDSDLNVEISSPEPIYIRIDSISSTKFTVSPYSSALLTIKYTCVQPGDLDLGSFRFENNSSNQENHYIRGTGRCLSSLGQEISVSESNLVIEDGGTDTIEISRNPNEAYTRYYYVKNVGSDSLNITNITTTNASNVTVTSITPSQFSLAKNGTKRIAYEYTAGAADGSFSFDMDIENSSSGNANYDIAVTGTIRKKAGATMGVWRSGNELPDGSSDPQGSHVTGNQVSRTYTIKNTGDTAYIDIDDIKTANLTNVTIDSISERSFNVENQRDVTIKYTPAGRGVFGFDLLFVCNNGADGSCNQIGGNYYDIAVSGEVLAPEIDLQRPVDVSIPDGENDVQGDRAEGVPVTLTYTVENKGSSPLNITDIVTDNTDAVSVNAISRTNFTVADGASENFSVTYTPNSTALFSFDLAITNDDPDEGNYIITVSGNRNQVVKITQQGIGDFVGTRMRQLASQGVGLNLPQFNGYFK